MSSTAAPPAGPGVDARGVPVVDPTANVLALVEAAVRRLDDLHDSETRHQREMNVLRDVATRERQRFNEELRKAETARIDAIRAVDVAAVQRAAEVSAAQTITLASATSTLAETLRAQVASVASAVATAQTTALEPIVKRIEELSRVQYEQQGVRAQQVESKGTSQWVVGLTISIAFLAIAIIGFALSVASKVK